jgi:hypothetical protein
MQTDISLKPKSQADPVIPLRAIVELIGGELKIYPLADSDVEEHQMLDALRFIREDHQ